MGSPEFDRVKFSHFLSLNSPVFEAPVSLILDPDQLTPSILAHYPVALSIQASGENVSFPLNNEIQTAHLFPVDFRPFTVPQLVGAVAGQTLDHDFVSLVDDQLQGLKVSVRWDTLSLIVNGINSRDDLYTVGCKVIITANMPRLNGQPQSYYMLSPFTAVSRPLLRVSACLTPQQIDQSWRDCWTSGVTFREFF